MAPAGTNISIEREVFPALVGRGCSATRRAATGWTSGRPTRYLQATFDILEGNVTTEIGRRLSDVGTGARRRRERSTAGSSRRRWSAADCVGRGARDRRRSHGARSSGVTVGEGAHIESSVLLDGVSVGRADDGPRARSSGPACRSASAATSTPASCSARGSRSGRTTSLPPARVSSPGWSCQTERSSFDRSTLDLDAEAIAAVDSQRAARRRPRHARSAARRAVAGRIGQPRASRLARRAGRRGDGRLGDRRRAGPRGPR